MNGRALRLFQVGFNRCGTQSIARLFAANGYRTAHWQGGRLAAAMEVARRRSEPLLSRAGDYQVHTDMEPRGDSGPSETVLPGTSHSGALP